MIVPAAEVKAMMAGAANAAMQQDGISPSTTPAAPKPTGKTDKIDGYNAAEYTFSNGAMTATFWMSTEFPNAKAVNDALAKFRKGSLADATKGFAPDMSSIPGVPVRTEVTLNGQKIVTDLVSATDQNVDPGEYQAPASYTLLPTPPMPSGMGGQ